MAALAVYGAGLLLLRGTGFAAAPAVLTPALAQVLLGVALALLVAAFTWTQYGVPAGPSVGPDAPSLDAQGERFLQRSLAASALAEAAGAVGFVLALLGGPLPEAAALLVASLFVQAALILPRGLAYWAAWERERPASAGTRGADA
jgi:hypothetical protein